MAISKNSIRIQFTLNTGKEKENQIVQFLNTCVNPSNSIKEIIYSYIVSNSGAKSPQVIHITKNENVQSEEKSLTFSESEQSSNNIVTHSEEKLQKASELELNEMEELNKFVLK